MSGVQQIVKSIFGSYLPTGVFSFEFRDNNKKIAEVYLMLPPESIQVNEPRRASITPTLTGNYIADYGNEVKTINISGSLHYFYVGSPKNPMAYQPTSFDVVDGYAEMQKLKFILSRYRDYTMTKDGKLISPSFSLPGLASVRTFKEYVRRQVSSGEGVLEDRLDLIFHNYDEDDHYKVLVKNFSYQMTNKDPNTSYYNIQLEAYERFKKTTAKFKQVKLTTAETIDNTVKNLAEISAPLPNSLQTVNVFLLDEKISDAKANLEYSNGLINSGTTTPERALFRSTDTFQDDNLTVQDNIVSLREQ